MWQQYLAFTSRTGVLCASGIGMAILMLFVFPALPVVGGDLIDLLPGYGYDELVAKLASYGDEGRRVHAWATPTLDTLFPIAYVSFWAGLIHRLRPRPGFLAAVPLVLGVWDLGENAQITAMLLSYPDVPRGLVRSASFFTSVKHALTALTMLTGLGVVLLALVQRVRHSTT